MTIKQLTLFSDKLEKEKQFYGKTLGFPLLENESTYFTVNIGQSKLTFQASEEKHLYHYCFLIPRNKLREGIEWLSQRLDLIEIEKGRVVQRFESWNADSVYFYDGTGNIAEFIVRYDLGNDSTEIFGLPGFLCVNEIGMPTRDVEKLNNQLEVELNSPFWKGDKKRFGTNGTQNGLFLLPNYEMKETWFPTDIKIKPSPFNAIISSNEKEYEVVFKNEKLEITPA